MPYYDSRDRKISNFPANQLVPGGSVFTFVYNGVNYQITDTNFYSALGVTGTIVQDGAVTGTPVLDTQGTVNNIRNLEDGPGIQTSVSAENGITIEHNFALDVTGAALSDDFTLAQPIFRSLVAGAGVTVTPSGDIITIAQQGSPAQQIVEVNNTYAIDPQDDIVHCTGTFTVTLPNAASFIHEVTVSSTTGTISLSADATINNSTPIASGSATTFYLANNTWWRK